MCEAARKEGVLCVENSGFLDAIDTPEFIKNKAEEVVAKAHESGKVLIIAHPALSP